jgi:hypothetical protein
MLDKCPPSLVPTLPPFEPCRICRGLLIEALTLKPASGDLLLEHTGACGYSRSATSSPDSNATTVAFISAASRSRTRAAPDAPGHSCGLLPRPSGRSLPDLPNISTTASRGVRSGLRRRAMADGVGRTRLQLQAHLPRQIRSPSNKGLPAWFGVCLALAENDHPSCRNQTIGGTRRTDCYR